MTLEEAQAEILRLQEENTELRTERDTLSQNNTQMTQDLEQVRALNQKYFNKLTAQYVVPDPEPEPEPVPSCEEFAKTLNL